MTGHFTLVSIHQTVARTMYSQPNDHCDRKQVQRRFNHLNQVHLQYMKHSTTAIQTIMCGETRLATKQLEGCFDLICIHEKWEHKPTTGRPQMAATSSLYQSPPYLTCVFFVTSNTLRFRNMIFRAEGKPNMNHKFGWSMILIRLCSWCWLFRMDVFSMNLDELSSLMLVGSHLLLQAARVRRVTCKARWKTIPTWAETANAMWMQPVFVDCDFLNISYNHYICRIRRNSCITAM